MTTISLALVLLYLLGLERVEQKQDKSKKLMQYKQDVGCYLFDL